MTLDLFDLLWNIPLLFAVFGGLWVMFKTKHDSEKCWPWSLMTAFAWFGNAVIETFQDNTLWMYLSAVLGTISVVMFMWEYHRAQDAKRDRIDNNK